MTLFDKLKKEIEKEGIVLYLTIAISSLLLYLLIVFAFSL